MAFEYKEELEHFDRDGVWYPVTVLCDDGGDKVKVESDLTCYEYWADREKLRKRQAAQQSVQSDVCPVCAGKRHIQTKSRGLVKCASCNGTGQRR